MQALCKITTLPRKPLLQAGEARDAAQAEVSRLTAVLETLDRAGVPAGGARPPQGTCERLPTALERLRANAASLTPDEEVQLRAAAMQAADDRALAAEEWSLADRQLADARVVLLAANVSEAGETGTQGLIAAEELEFAARRRRDASAARAERLDGILAAHRTGGA